MHIKRVVRVVCVLATVLLLGLMSLAQSLAGGAIDGTVTDGTGAVIAGANLTAKNVAKGLTYNASSNEAGLFAFPVLPVGTYEITAEKQGFQKLAQNVTVSVGSKINLPVIFKVAGSSQEVTVSSEAPLVETTRTQVSSNVGERAIKELPVNGRNFIDFVLLTPGVTRDPNRGGDLSFAGQRGTLNSLTVDGADNNNTFFGQTTGRTGSGRAPYQFSQDAVQEFQVASNSYSAELGRAGGAVINVVTKSGTNQFHGAGFEYYRDQSLNAYDPIFKQTAFLAGKTPAAKPKYHFNQFGGNFGGPIVKNKAFFFVDYDGQRNVQPNIFTFTPPAAVVTNAATCTTPAATTACYQKAALDYLTPRATTFARGLDQNTWMTKFDYAISSKHQLNVRWNNQRFTGKNFENSGNTNAQEHTGNSLVQSDTITSQLTSTLSNSMVNVFRFTYLRDREPGQANSNNPEAVVKDVTGTILNVGRNNFSPRETTIKRQQYGDTLTVVKGRHNIKFGADAIVDKIYNYFPGFFSGGYNFNTLEDFGRSLSGVPVLNAGTYFQQNFAGTGTTGATTHPDMIQPAFFAQDDFRVNSKLTLNLGVRYDLQLVKQPSVQNAALLAYGYDTSKIDISKNEFAPRFGFAYNPWGDGKVTIRGGYGMFYGNTPSIMLGTAHSGNGINVASYRYTGAQMPSYPNNKCGAPSATPDCAAPSTGGVAQPTNVFVVQKDFKNPVVQQGNLATEVALTKDVALTVSYLWVKGTHLQRTNDVNLPTSLTSIAATDSVTGQQFTYQRYAPAGAAIVRPLPFARISEFESNANSNYNALAVELRKRFSHNFQASVAYTWSHAIDDNPDATAVVVGTDDAKLNMYPTNVGFDRGNSGADLRHRMVLSYVWDLKYGQNLPKAIRWVTDGWQWSGILTAQSGLAYSAFINGDLNGDGNSVNDRVPGTGRNQFRMPATWSLDPRLSRTIGLHGESTKLQLFAEAFNLFNRFNVTGVKTQQYSLTNATTFKAINQANASASYFGLPTGTSGQRVVQLGAKVSF